MRFLSRLTVAAGLAALASATFVAPASAGWPITKTHWSAEDERDFEAFVTQIGESNCSTPNECMRSSANRYVGTDHARINFDSDCADLAYFLRAYYASKNGLPFSFAAGVRPRIRGQSDLRFNTGGNLITDRVSITGRGGANPGSVFNRIRDVVSSATFRVGPEWQDAPYTDFYSPVISRETIRPGMPVYDINGHVVVIYKVAEDGRIHYMDSHPDYSLTRSVFGAQFGRADPNLGAGIKAWRPIELVGATRRGDELVGGRIVFAPNEEIATFSMEQYHGNVPDPGGDWHAGKFIRDGVEMGYYEYVRAQLSSGEFHYNPVYELSATMRSLCADLHDRAAAVEIAIDAGIHRKEQPGRLPPNIYGTDQMEWEIYSTPSRDARLKTRFVEFRSEMGRLIQLWIDRDTRVSYDGLNLKEDLLEAFQREAAACRITYSNSNRQVVTLNFTDIMHRIFRLSFDPYHCIERRWGATSEAELASCPDGGTKRRWYLAEQGLRNQIERTYERRMDFTVSQLEDGVPGSGTLVEPDVDVLKLIENIGPRVAFQGMQPRGE